MSQLVTVEQLRQFAPGARWPQTTADTLSAYLPQYGIDKPIYVAHFMAQTFVESGGFSVLEEDLNYSAQRLMQVWPRRFPTVASAAPYARNPRALACVVYGGRLGNTGPNDGWLYRGGGWIQLTGKDNYRAASQWTGVDLVSRPDLIRMIPTASQTACAFWKARGLNEIIDADSEEAALSAGHNNLSNSIYRDLDEIVRRVNGGSNGLDARIAAFRRAISIWIP